MTIKMLKDDELYKKFPPITIGAKQASQGGDSDGVSILPVVETFGA
jgi:hypothetical protein